MKEGDFVYGVSELGLLRGPIINFLDEDKDPDDLNFDECSFVEIYAFDFKDPDYFGDDFERVDVPKENVFTNLDDAIELFRKVESERNS